MYWQCCNWKPQHWWQCSLGNYQVQGQRSEHNISIQACLESQWNSKSTCLITINVLCMYCTYMSIKVYLIDVLNTWCGNIHVGILQYIYLCYNHIVEKKKLLTVIFCWQLYVLHKVGIWHIVKSITSTC